MARVSVFVAMAMVAASGAGAQAQPQAAASAWYTAGHVLLSVTEPGVGLATAWQFDRADNGDIHIVRQDRRGTAGTAGTLMSVCDDRALLFKDIAPAKRRELNELDEPILLLQLALRLLARAMPEGPHAIGAGKTVDIGGAKASIQVRKGSSVRRDFLAPWQLHGKVAPGEHNGARFDFTFSYTTGDVARRRDEMALSGTWQEKSRVPAFDNDFAIPDWQVYRVDKVVNFVGGNAELEPALVPQPLRFQTLGELRARIERNWDPNPRARKQMECKL